MDVLFLFLIVVLLLLNLYWVFLEGRVNDFYVHLNNQIYNPTQLLSTGHSSSHVDKKEKNGKELQFTVDRIP